MNIASAARSPVRGVAFDRPVLVSNLVSGSLWLLLPAAFEAWPLSVIGGAYVITASLFLGMVYGRGPATKRQESLAWAVPWLSAVALWATIIGAMEFENSASHYLSSLSVGVLLGTLCYLGWQVLALAIRQAMSGRMRLS